MDRLFAPDLYWTVTTVMVILAVIVFLALQKLTAGYGMMYNTKWGPSINNRAGWIIMEAPSFFGMIIFWVLSARPAEMGAIVIASLFLLHYFQRTFIFPLLIKGKSRMPWAIILMGVTFNLVNAYLIAGWLFYMSPAGMYDAQWLVSPRFLIGTVVFFLGMGINIQSDNIVRHLRKPGDTRHYIPRGGAYRYVTAGNYFGEILEWAGYAVLTWSVPGVVFMIWTFANLAPRAKKLHQRYLSEFGDEYASLNRRYVLPFLY